MASKYRFLYLWYTLIFIFTTRYPLSCFVAIGGDKDLKFHQIAAISSLALTKKSNKEIATITGVSLRSVPGWTLKSWQAGDTTPTLQEKRPGRDRTLRVVQRVVKSSPRISSKEIKEKNPQLLQGASVRTVQRRLRDNLHFDYRIENRR